MKKDLRAFDPKLDLMVTQEREKLVLIYSSSPDKFLVEKQTKYS